MLGIFFLLEDEIPDDSFCLEFLLLSELPCIDEAEDGLSRNSPSIIFSSRLEKLRSTSYFSPVFRAVSL